jgi:predicted enzyme related to lactoylglutathione lyase
MKLSGVMIGSSDAKALGEFYIKVLGEASWRDKDWYGFEAGVMVGPHSEVTGKSEDPKRIMFNFEVNDVKGEFARIKELGATMVAEPYSPNPEQPDMVLATFADPDGNYFQLAPPWK